MTQTESQMIIDSAEESAKHFKDKIAECVCESIDNLIQTNDVKEKDKTDAEVLFLTTLLKNIS